MAFTNYLIKIGGSDGVSLPLKWIRFETYDVSPMQIMDLDSTRNAKGKLVRTALAHRASKIEFDTPCSMTNKDVAELMELLRSNFTVPGERKIHIRYYNPETDSYREGDFYMPDITWKIRNVDVANHIVNYNETRIAFIEY